MSRRSFDLSHKISSGSRDFEENNVFTTENTQIQIRRGNPSSPFSSFPSKLNPNPISFHSSFPRPLLSSISHSFQLSLCFSPSISILTVSGPFLQYLQRKVGSSGDQKITVSANIFCNYLN